MDRRIKFRHLEVFAAIARVLSLKRAAEELNLTQPAVSKTLRELEEITGKQLADRSRAGVRLTPDGELFLTFAEQSTAAITDGLRHLQHSGGAGGRLRVGALPSVASSILPDAVSAFARGAADTLVEIFEGPHVDLTARLRRGDLELVIGRLGRPETMTGLAFEKLHDEDVVIVARPDSTAVAQTDFAGLDRFRVIYPPKDSAIRPLVARMLIAQGVPIYPHRLETASAAFGRAMVMSDPGVVWVISEGVVARDLAQGHLVRLDLDTGLTRGAVGVMTRADEVSPPVVRQFVGILKT